MILALKSPSCASLATSITAGCVARPRGSGWPISWGMRPCSLLTLLTLLTLTRAAGESCYVTRLQSPAHTDWRAHWLRPPITGHTSISIRWKTHGNCNFGYFGDVHSSFGHANFALPVQYYVVSQNSHKRRTIYSKIKSLHSNLIWISKLLHTYIHM